MTGIITPFVNGKPYHSRYSGYERLIKYYPDNRVYFTLNYNKISFLLFPLRAFRILPKMYRTFKAELDCLNENNVIFHLYGEATFFLSGFKVFRKNKKVVVAFHEFEKRFEKNMPFYWKLLLKDAEIIVISPSQKRFFMKYFPKHKIHLIPHGIDIHYFKANKKVKKKNQIIAVGDYLRDYDTLLKAMELVKKTLPGLKLIVVAKENNKKFDANYEFRKGISDSKLLRLYRESLFQVLPLNVGTANNALLEGCACGLPLISIDSENIKFYFKDVITYTDYRDLADKIIWAYNNLNNIKVNISHLSWENVIKKIEAVVNKNAQENVV